MLGMVRGGTGASSGMRTFPAADLACTGNESSTPRGNSTDRQPPSPRCTETETPNLSDEIDRRIRAGWMGFKRYKRELYDHPKASLLPLKARMVRSELVEALVWMRDIDPPEGPLRQAPYNTPQGAASNSRSLVQVAEQAHPLVQRRP